MFRPSLRDAPSKVTPQLWRSPPGSRQTTTIPPGKRARLHAKADGTPTSHAGPQSAREARDEHRNSPHTTRAGPGTAGLRSVRRNLVRLRVCRRHRHECELYRPRRRVVVERLPPRRRKFRLRTIATTEPDIRRYPMTPHSAAWSVLALALLLAAPNVGWANAGDLDPSFGKGGTVTT